MVMISLDIVMTGDGDIYIYIYIYIYFGNYGVLILLPSGTSLSKAVLASLVSSK
jgi:hypothetical protein